MLLIVFQAEGIKVQFPETKGDMLHPGHRESAVGLEQRMQDGEFQDRERSNHGGSQKPY